MSNEKDIRLGNDLSPRRISSHDFKLKPHKMFRIVNEYFESVTISGKTDPLYESWEEAEIAIVSYLESSQSMRGKYTIVVVYINLPTEK